MTRLQDSTGDDWKALADEYQKLTADVASRPIGTMLKKADDLLPFSKATGILDNGCGPGPVMSRLLTDYDIPASASLTCSDFSKPMIEKVEEVKAAAVKQDSTSAWNRVQTVVQNAMDLESIQDSSVSHVTAGWVYFMTPDPQKCLAESKRVLKDGGVLTCSSWQSSQWIDLMTTISQIRSDKQQPQLPEEWSSAEAMKKELEKAGFQEVQSEQVPTTMKFEKLEPFVEFMMTKMPHIVKMTEDFSEDERNRLKALWMDGTRQMCPNEPGELHGVALVAVGLNK